MRVGGISIRRKNNPGSVQEMGKRSPGKGSFRVPGADLWGAARYRAPCRKNRMIVSILRMQLERIAGAGHVFGDRFSFSAIPGTARK